MKPSPAARRAAMDIMVRFVPRNPKNESETLDLIATIIEQETHCGAMKEALRGIVERANNHPFDPIGHMMEHEAVGIAARAVLDKVK